MRRCALSSSNLFLRPFSKMTPSNKHYLIDEDDELLNHFNELSPAFDKEKFSRLSKCIYRIKILEERQAHFGKCFGHYLPNTLNAVKYLTRRAIELCGIENAPPNVSLPKKGGNYDYQSSDALKLVKAVSAITGERLTATQVAEKIISHIPDNDFIESMEVSHPGFINFKIKKSYILDICRWLILERKVRPPLVRPRRVVVDFSSPNIAKEMHVGHLRSTIIGESICRIFDYVGFEVVRVSHVGDWGTQFGMLIAYLEEKFPNYVEDPPEISDLQVFYRDSKKRFDEDTDFKKKAHIKVVDLQNGKDPNVTTAWERICEISRRDFQNLYKRLGVSVMEKGESFYQSRMSTVIDELVKKGVVEQDGHCKIIRVPGVKVPLILVKSDGGYTYDTSDIATLKYRLAEEKADWIIYVVDSGQREHFETLFKFGRMVGWYDPDVQRVEHIGFGIVLDAEKKRFRTRSGETIKLVELLNEGVSRSKTKLIERGMKEKFSPEELDKVSESLAYSCIKYADLSRHLASDYEFSYDRMLEDRGNTAIYLLYAYARIRSILRKTKVTPEEISEYVAEKGLYVEHENELVLMRKLIQFPEVIFRIVFEIFPHYLCDYLYELCSLLTDYYDSCIIIDSSTGKPNMNRLSQIYATSLILNEGFHLLGLHALERM